MIQDTYKGMIDWEYIDKDEYNPKEYVIWVCNEKKKGGYFLADSYSAELKNEYVDEDDRAAVGRVVWWLIKLGLSTSTGQWWILGCG